MKIKNSDSKFIELILVTFFTVLMIFFLRGQLFYGSLTYVHDNFNWALPININFISEFSTNLFEWNLWNSFIHGGESLITSYMQLRIFDPITLVIIYIGKVLNLSPLLIFNWDRFLKSLIGAIGIYILFRQNIGPPIGRLLLFISIIFSSLVYCSFVQDGITDIFYSTPYVALFLTNIFHNKSTSLYNFAGLVFFIGITFQSYFFAPLGIFILLFICWHFKSFFQLLKNSQFKLYSILAILSLIVISLPMVVYLLDLSGDLFFAARAPRSTLGLLNDGPATFFNSIDLTAPSKSLIDFSQIVESGTKNTLDSFITAFIFGQPLLLSGEAYFYFGIAPLFLFVYGFLTARVQGYKFWRFALIFFSLLSLGYPMGLHQILYASMPYLMQFRHLHVLLGFILLGTFYFLSLGIDKVFIQSGHTLLSTLNENIFDNLKTKWLLMSFDIFKCIVFVIFNFIVLSTINEYINNAIFNFYQFIGITALFVISILSNNLIKNKLLNTYLIFVTVYIFTFKSLNLHTTIFFLSTFLFLAIKYLDQRYRDITVVVILLISAIDLTTNFATKSIQYSVNSPSINRSAGRVDAPAKRYLAPDYDDILRVGVGRDGDQFMRYQGMVTGKAYLLQSFNLKDSKKIQINDLFQVGMLNSFSLNKRFADLIFSGIDEEILNSLIGAEFPIIRIVGSYRLSNKLADDIKSSDKKNIMKFLEDGIYLDVDNSSIQNLPPPTMNGITSRIDVLNYKPSSISMRVNASQESILYFADGYDKYWTASVNGNEAHVFPANSIFKAIVIPAGESLVTFQYSPTLFLLALISFYLTLLLAVLVFLISLLYSRGRG